jgi:hypothetical protein
MPLLARLFLIKRPVDQKLRHVSSAPLSSASRSPVSVSAGLVPCPTPRQVGSPAPSVPPL